jgi:hypothetical protein
MAESKQAQSPLPVAQDHEDATPQRSRRGLDSRSFIAGLCIALTINGGGLLALWWTVRHPETKTTKVAEVYVDAKLVKFGKKRDMSWLPHVPVSPKTVEKPNTLKLAIDPNKPVVKKEEPKRNEDLSKLADKLKNLRTDEDDRARSSATEEGDPNGVRGGSAQEASGDPYILQIMAAVVERWTVPTMLTPGELARLSASACLTIAEDGTLTSFRIIEPSGNSFFDGSLLSTLGQLKQLPKPHGRFARAALNGKLCPSFSKQ